MPMDLGSDFRQVTIGHASVDIVKKRILMPLVSIRVESERDLDILVAANPLKKLKRASGPLRSSGRRLKNL